MVIIRCGMERHIDLETESVESLGQKPSRGRQYRGHRYRLIPTNAVSCAAQAYTNDEIKGRLLQEYAVFHL